MNSLIKKIKTTLKKSNDLRLSPWKNSDNYLAGHCYVASEAIYFLLGGKEAGWTPVRLKYCGATHWWIKHESGQIIDITAKQFKHPVPYHKGRGAGFLTKSPSKRTCKLLERIANVK